MERKGGQALQAEPTAQAKTRRLDQQFSVARLKEEGAGEETGLAKGERGKVGRVNRGGVYKAKCNKAP